MQQDVQKSYLHTSEAFVHFQLEVKNKRKRNDEGKDPGMIIASVNDTAANGSDKVSLFKRFPYS